MEKPSKVHEDSCFLGKTLGVSLHPGPAWASPASCPEYPTEDKLSRNLNNTVCLPTDDPLTLFTLPSTPWRSSNVSV